MAPRASSTGTVRKGNGDNASRRILRARSGSAATRAVADPARAASRSAGVSQSVASDTETVTYRSGNNAFMGRFATSPPRESRRAASAGVRHAASRNCTRPVSSTAKAASAVASSFRASSRAATVVGVTNGRSAARVTTRSATGSAAASAATGPAPGGVSWICSTWRSRSSRCGPTTVTRAHPSTAPRAVSSILRPPTVRAGLSTPPMRVARPPATITASTWVSVLMSSCCLIRRARDRLYSPCPAPIALPCPAPIALPCRG